MKKRFGEFIEWFNAQEKGELMNISQIELLLHITYSSLREYIQLLVKEGCIKIEGRGNRRKYFKIKNYGLEKEE
ncbi:hypothetical protein DRN75_03850 [Nanoarchaeota archaeon]|nr:MAG: hypothetical protein DRN75_03850 [Nanoarchaeota archaeon]